MQSRSFSVDGNLITEGLAERPYEKSLGGTMVLHLPSYVLFIEAIPKHNAQGFLRDPRNGAQYDLIRSR